MIILDVFLRHNSIAMKSELFEPDLQQLAQLFKALGHPARLAILRYLAQTKVCMTGEISDVLPLSRTTVKQHLTELKEVGIIRGEIEGSKVNYCVNLEILENIRLLIGNFLDDIHCCSTDCCK